VSLAHAKLGDGGRWRELWDLNRDFIPNPRTILPGQTLRLPDERPVEAQTAEPSAAELKGEERVYIVRSMDSLSWIAKRELGSGARWREIWLLNRDRLPSPNLLYPGMALRIPPAITDTVDAPEPEPLGDAQSSIDSEPGQERELTPQELRAQEVHERWGEMVALVSLELDVPRPVCAALLMTEHRMNGFERDGQLRIRLERQIFAGRTGQWVSNLHRGPADERRALASALSCDEQAAYASLAMGGAGLMGFRWRLLGYESPRAMWEAMSESEASQVRALFSLLATVPELLFAARERDWIGLAREVNQLRGTRKTGAVELEALARIYGRL